MLHMPTPMLMGAPQGGRSYAEFQAHIATLATSGSVAWDNISQVIGLWRTTTGAPTGTMSGSPWLSIFRNITTTARMIQHAMPDEATFNAVVASGGEVFYEVVFFGNAASAALDRNGYLSSASSTASHRTCPRMIFYHPALGPMITHPDVGGGAEPYAWSD